MSNNTPDYEDNLYFDSQNTKNEQQKDLCITSEQLTEQWKKGELPYGRYYVELAYNGNNIIMAEYWWDKALTLDDHEYSREEVKRILAPVPSYEEWQAKLEENAQLKELLKECELWFTGIVGNMNDKNVGEHNRGVPIGNFEYIFKVFSQKIKEVLK